ncbi:MAG: hypothetical protein QXX12_07030 [Nanopusillaceae archaeon]
MSSGILGKNFRLSWLAELSEGILENFKQKTKEGGIAMEKKIYIPYGKQIHKELTSDLKHLTNSEYRQAVFEKINSYVFEYLIKQYGMKKAKLIWFEDAIDWQLKLIWPYLKQIFKQGKVPKFIPLTITIKEY